MHINLESDYALRIVHFLATTAQRADAQTISEQAVVSLRFTLKIMQKLVSAGIVRSYKGAKGGYELTRSPGEITLYQVIEAMEGPYRFSRCVGGDYTCNCGNAAGCRFYGVFDDITRTVIEQLSRVTFEDPQSFT